MSAGQINQRLPLRLLAGQIRWSHKLSVGLYNYKDDLGQGKEYPKIGWVEGLQFHPTNQPSIVSGEEERGGEGTYIQKISTKKSRWLLLLLPPIGAHNLYGYSLCSALEHNIITNGFRWTSTSGTDGMRSQAASSHCQCSHPIPSPSCRGLRRRQTIFVIVIDVDYVRLDGRVGDCRNRKAVLSVGWASWVLLPRNLGSLD